MNKNKIFGLLIVLAIAVVAAWNVSIGSQNNKNLSAILIANVEALADEMGDRTDGTCMSWTDRFCTIYTIYSGGGASSSTYLDAWYTY